MTILDDFVDDDSCGDGADAFRDRCGVVGVYGDDEAANLAYLAMYALQHRGQESAGIVAGDGENLKRKIGVGLVADVFSETDLAALPGKVAIGHVRYATAGDSSDPSGFGLGRDAQPLLVRCQAGPIAVAHNGNLVNADQVRAQFEERGSIFQTSSDTETILHLVATSHGSLLERLQKSLKQVRGAYSLTLMGDGRLYGVRDPSGVRPLVLGKLARGNGIVIASETCAFDLIGASYVRDIEPGELVVVDERGVTSAKLDNPENMPVAHCIFEHVYFARPDSLVFGRYVHEARKALGKQLAREAPADAEVVIPVPDSGVYAAMGFAEVSGIPFEMGLVRNHYVGRTFIEPEQRIRHFGVKLKLNPVRSILDGKRVVVVDDSIVRGTTSKKIVEMVRTAGAKEIHLRISAPSTTGPCYYGIDTPTKEELIASRMSVAEIAKFVGADSLAYLSRAGLHAAVRNTSDTKGACDACFSGDYPIPIGSHKARSRC
jgi:amidophosphoribosyltransferase